MAVNKRDPFESEEHLRYKCILTEQEIPKNVLILFGDSKVSSYFIINESDLVIISWSTIGLEALLLGAPVISAFPNYLMYPLASFSKQPETQAEMEKAMFGNSNFGEPQNARLLSWVGLAFETQFFATTAPRGRGGVFGKLYRGIYKLVKRVGGYQALAGAVDAVFLRNVKLEHERLFVKKQSNTLHGRINEYLVTGMLRRYRKKYRNQLAEYGSEIRRSIMK
jgi:hypothetical protein